MQGALGMVREHWDMTRGGGRAGAGQQKKRNGGGILGGGSVGAMDLLSGKKDDRDPMSRHPNQYTKKRMQQGSMQGGSMGMGGAVPATQHNAAAGLYASPYALGPHTQHAGHPMGMTAVDAVKVRKGGAGGVVVDVGRQASSQGMGQGQGMLYSGMASQEEYNQATGGGMGMARASGSKRKIEEGNGARKKTKKGYALCVLLTSSARASAVVLIFSLAFLSQARRFA